MFGRLNSHILGRITRDISVQKNSSGKAFCIFTVCVNARSFHDPKSGEIVQPDAKFYDLVAHGNIAESIARNAQKGTVIDADVAFQCTERKVEKNGVTTIYQNVLWRVLPGFELIQTAGKADSSSASAPRSAAQPTAAAVGYSDDTAASYSDGADDYGDFETGSSMGGEPSMTSEEIDIASVLPY